MGKRPRAIGDLPLALPSFACCGAGVPPAFPSLPRCGAGVPPALPPSSPERAPECCQAARRGLASKPLEGGASMFFSPLGRTLLPTRTTPAPRATDLARLGGSGRCVLATCRPATYIWKAFQGIALPFPTLIREGLAAPLRLSPLLVAGGAKQSRHQLLAQQPLLGPRVSMGCERQNRRLMSSVGSRTMAARDGLPAPPEPAPPHPLAIAMLGLE